MDCNAQDDYKTNVIAAEGRAEFSSACCAVAQNLIQAKKLLQQKMGGAEDATIATLQELLGRSEEQVEASENEHSINENYNLKSRTNTFTTLLLLSAFHRDIAILRCQVSGKKRNLKMVVIYADATLLLNDSIAITSNMIREEDSDINKQIRHKIVSSTLSHQASALGYKGYGLLQQKSYYEAAPILEQSLKLFNSCDNKNLPAEKRLAKYVQRYLDLCRRQLCSDAEEITIDTLPPLIKFPRTTHLIDMGASTEDDLVNSDVAALERIIACNGESKTRVVVEEKVDGANVGISLSPTSGELLIQNRSHYISAGEHAQFSRLAGWIAEHEVSLRRVLQQDTVEERNWILYGEWLVARHSIPYHKLPGYFVAFDLYDRTTQRFVSRRHFHHIMRDAQIPVAPTMLSNVSFGPYSARGQPEIERSFRTEVVKLLERQSAFRIDDGPVEGIVLRIDDDDWLEERFKIVRSDFIAGCGEGHWSKRTIEKQRIDFGFAQEYLQTCYPMADVVESESRTQGEEGIKPEELTKEQIAGRNRARRRVPRCVMLMGLPGSGKTTFSNLLKAGGDDWIHVNQDLLGRKAALKEAAKAGRTKRIIIDRCHPTASERQEWMETMHAPPKGQAVLVYFSAPLEECTTRVRNRMGHPGIPAGKGGRIVQQVAARLEPPTAYERAQIFGVVEVVTSFDEAQVLLRKWGVGG